MLPIMLLAIACGGGKDDSGGAAATTDTDPAAAACTGSPRVVLTDIDATLTTSDAEWLDQMLNNPGRDLAMRPQANTVMNTWADLGYTVIYITARGEDVVLGDSRTAREATEEWLLAKGFPTVDGNLYLAPGTGALGEEAAIYKSGVVDELVSAGLEPFAGYGDKDTDIEAWKHADIPADRIFHVGEDTTDLGVEALSDADAYGAHMSGFMATVPSACE